MMTQPEEFPSVGWEKVFVRHAEEKHRLDVSRIGDSVKAPFHSSSSGCGPWVDYPLSGRWLLGVRLAGQAWLPLFSNAASGEAMFKASAKSRKLEIVCVGCDPAKRGWFFLLNRAGTRAVEFSLPAKQGDKLEKAKFKSTELEADWLAGCRSGREAVERLCRHFEIEPFACDIDTAEGRFRVVDRQGKALRVHGRFDRTGPALVAGENSASDALSEAIERCDPQAIRQAVADGARLDALPDTSVPPLLSALYNCAKPRGKDCVAALVELGCPVDGDPYRDPTVLDCTERFLGETLSLEMLETIVPLGAKVNVLDPRNGQSALLNPVVYRRIGVIRYLLAHGADPTLRGPGGIAPIDWLRQKIDGGIASEEQRGEYRQILELLTGESPATESEPPSPLPAERSEVVRQQIAECLGVERSRVTAGANFFTELGGGPQHLDPLGKRVEQALGVSIETVVDAINVRTQLDAEGNLSYDSLTKFREYLPGWSPTLRPAPLMQLFTVALIESMVAKAYEEKAAPVSDAPLTLDPEHQAKVRKMLAERANVAVEDLTPQMNLFRDLKLEGNAAGFLLILLKTELNVDLLEIWKELQTEFQVDAQGRLTESSQNRLRRVLPGIRIDAPPPLTVDDLYTVATLEAIVAKGLGQRPADLPTEDITSPAQQEWVHRLPQGLGERKLRLLLAGACRYAFQPQRSLEPAVTEALELLEHYADTGDSKRALRDLRRKYWDEWWQGDTLGQASPQHALLEALRPNEPEEAVTNVAHAIRHAHKISGPEALGQLQRLHRDLVSPPAGAGQSLSAYRMPPIVDLASTMYESRDFGEMPGLADLLEQAGCTNQAVLEHCRDPQALHLRGCWLIDALLGRS